MNIRRTATLLVAGIVLQAGSINATVDAMLQGAEAQKAFTSGWEKPATLNPRDSYWNTDAQSYINGEQATFEQCIRDAKAHKAACYKKYAEATKKPLTYLYEVALSFT